MTRIELTEQTMAELHSIMRKQSGNAGLARRARCVLLCAGGGRRVDIRKALSCDAAHAQIHIHYTPKYSSGLSQVAIVGARQAAYVKTLIKSIMAGTC